MPILGIIASSISGSKAVTNSYESIQTVTVGAGGSSAINFSSIPSTYKHLQLRILWNNPTADQSMYITYNGVSTGTSYAYHQLNGNGSTASAYAQASVSKWESFYDGNNASSSYLKVGVLDILDYANTNKVKTSRLLWGADYNGSGAVQFASSLFNSTNAISSITLQPFSTNFGTNSTVALYGIKG